MADTAARVAGLLAEATTTTTVARIVAATAIRRALGAIAGDVADLTALRRTVRTKPKCLTGEELTL